MPIGTHRHPIGRALAALALLLASVGVAQAQPKADATTFLRARHDEVVKILKQRAAGAQQLEQRNGQLTAKLATLLDYQELSKRALRDHWDGLSEEQRKEFSALLARLVERSYRQNLESTLEFKVDYGGARKQGDETLVQTVARSTKNRRAPEVMIDYTMVPGADDWRVCDVTTDGVSLVANYRSQFNRIIRKDGWKALLERMQKKLDEGDDK